MKLSVIKNKTRHFDSFYGRGLELFMCLTFFIVEIRTLSNIKRYLMS